MSQAITGLSDFYQYKMALSHLNFCRNQISWGYLIHLHLILSLKYLGFSVLSFFFILFFFTSVTHSLTLIDLNCFFACVFHFISSVDIVALPFIIFSGCLGLIIHILT